MNRTILLFVAIALVAAIGIWIGAKAGRPVIEPPDLTRPQTAAVALLPVEGKFDEEGMIAMDQGTNANRVPYIVYTVEKGGGTQGIATKKLVFRSEYACQAGDLPCAVLEQGAPPVSAGEQVRVVGWVRDDAVLVERIEKRP